MDIESLETFVLASIAVHNHSKSPKKARLIPQPVMVATIPCHPHASAEKIMVPEVSLIGVSQGRQYRGDWALLTRHSADYLSDVHPHPLTYSKIVWKRIKLGQGEVGMTEHPFTDVISLYKATQEHAVQTKTVMVSSLPKCAHFEREFEFRSELGIMSEFQNDAITVKVFCNQEGPHLVEEFTPRSIIFSISLVFCNTKTQQIDESGLTTWIRMIDQIIKLFGVIDSFYTDELALQPKGLDSPDETDQYLSSLKRVLSERIQKFEAVLDLIILPLQRNLELAGLVAPEVTALFNAQHTLTLLKAGIESTEPRQLVNLLQLKFKHDFPQEVSFWFNLLQKFGESFWKQLLRDLLSKMAPNSIETLRSQFAKLRSDQPFGDDFKLMHDMSHFASCQYMWQQRGAVYTISDSVQHQKLESMQLAYKKFKFIYRFRPPAYSSFFGHHGTPLEKLRLETNKSQTQGLLPQPLFRRGSYRFTKLNATLSSANHSYIMPKASTQPQNIVVVKPGCYLDLVRNQNEIFYKLVFIDRVTAANFDLGRRVTPNGLGNPSVVGGLDISQLKSSRKLAEPVYYDYYVCCVEFSKKWIFMVLLADPKQFYLAKVSICEDGSVPCTLDLYQTLLMSSNPVELTGLRRHYYGRFDPSRTFPLCCLEKNNTLLMAQPFSKVSPEKLDHSAPLQICLMTINFTENDMKVSVYSVFDSGHTIDSVGYTFLFNPIGHSALYRPELGFYFKWQLIEGRTFGVWLKNTHEYTVYALHRDRFTQTHSGKLRLGLSPRMQQFREILPSSHGAYWLPFAIAQRTAFQPGHSITFELQTFRLKLI